MTDNAWRRAEEAVANCRHLFYGCNECDPWGESPSGACSDCVADAVAAARREEREACAKLVEDHGHSNGRIRATHKHLAAALRAGGPTEGERMKPEYKPQTDEEKLGYLVEECGEVLAAVGKTIRWGPECVNPELPPDEQETNREWVLRELTDLTRAIRYVRDMFQDEGKAIENPG